MNEKGKFNAKIDVKATTKTGCVSTENLITLGVFKSLLCLTNLLD